MISSAAKRTAGAVVGAVPEHFSLPLRAAVEAHGHAGARYRAVPEGTGEMVAQLETGALDVVAGLTEGLAAAIARGAPLSLLGVYVRSPLQWAVSAGPDSHIRTVPDITLAPKTVLGVSRLGSGSHLMALTLRNADPAKLQFKEYGTFERLRAAARAGEVDAFLWERWMSKPFQDEGELRSVAVIKANWPAFTLACRAGWEGEAWAREVLLPAVAREAAAFSSSPAAAADAVASECGIERADAERWVQSTEFGHCEPLVGSHGALRALAQSVAASGLVSSPPVVPSVIPSVVSSVSSSAVVSAAM